MSKPLTHGLVFALGIGLGMGIGVYIAMQVLMVDAVYPAHWILWL